MTPTDAPPFPLDRIVALELRGGCRDRALTSGFDRMLSTQAERGAGWARELLDALPAGGYRGMNRNARGEWLRSLPARAPQDGRGARAPVPQDRVPGRGLPQPPRARGEPPPGEPRTPTRHGRRVAAEPEPPLPRPDEPRVRGREHAGRAGPGRSPQPAPDDAWATPLADCGLGLSPTRQQALRRLGLHTAGDLLRHYPLRHHDFSVARPLRELRAGDTQAARGVITEVSAARVGKSRREATVATIRDRSGALKVTWFNMAFLARKLKAGQEIALAGKVTWQGRRVTMANPEFIVLDSGVDAIPLLPVYPTTRGVPVAAMREIIGEALDHFLEDGPERDAPASLRERRAIMPATAAMRALHYPDSRAQAQHALRSVAYLELLAVQLCVGERRAERETVASAPVVAGSDAGQDFRESLPFTLTGAQERVIAEILDDMGSGRAMGRLLQGDVGSGKTVVAAAAMLEAIDAGFQCALLAPTEVLANQHYRTLCALFGAGKPDAGVAVGLAAGQRPVRLARLTGRTSGIARERRLRDIASGAADVVVGTQALIEDTVEFKRLGLAVVDEQHRFGVMQRARMRDQGDGAHLLAMTATPIPRSMALTLYGDLDISRIDELPAGRHPVRTEWLRGIERGNAYAAIVEEVQAGRQAFVICPLVEGSANVQARAATEEFDRLRAGPLSAFADRVGLLHGRMRAAEKDTAMRRFAEGECAVLVATSVVEVGIDVPNATVIAIEGAGRFGLAQLHQLRGRVGRGAHAGRCFLLDDEASEEAEERLSMIERHSDGFALAEADLELRGPGNVFGREQSGRAGLHAASLADHDLVAAARSDAIELRRRDPGLALPEHAGLRRLAADVREGIIAEAH